MKHRLQPILLLLLLLLLSTSPLFLETQSTTGVIQGKVEDASGAVVAGAVSKPRVLIPISVVMPPPTVTEDLFSWPCLLRSSTLEVAGKSGFAPLEQTNLVLTVGQAISLNLQLKVSSGNEKIVVTDDSSHQFRKNLKTAPTLEKRSARLQFRGTASLKIC